MVVLQNKSLSSIQPVTFNYFDSNLCLSTKKIYATEDNVALYTINGLANYQDCTFNRYSCLMLTSAVSLSSLFANKQVYTPSNIVTYLKTNNNSFLCYDTASNTVLLSSSPSYFIFTPTDSNNYQIIADGYYLQIDTTAPYIIRGSTTPVNDSSSLFALNLSANNTLTLSSAYSIGTNTSTYQNGALEITTNLTNANILSSVPLSKNNNTDYIPNNPWVSYYMNYILKGVSKDLTINSIFNDVKINYFVDFPYEEAAQTGVANINISNLKTRYTPQGYPIPFSNLILLNTEYELAFLAEQLLYGGELIYFTQ
jgi:hypothetical protein